MRPFVQALSLTGSTVKGDSSKGAYLHGSFNSSNSRSMAALDIE